MATRSPKAVKTAQIIARIEIKKNVHGEAVHGHVVYQVRSSNGRDVYLTTLINGKATGCDCPSHGKCYHRDTCENLESKRVVIKVGVQTVSGVTADHAVARALRLVRPAIVPQMAQVAPVVSPECPVIAPTEECVSAAQHIADEEVEWKVRQFESALSGGNFAYLAKMSAERGLPKCQSKKGHVWQLTQQFKNKLLAQEAA